MIRKGCLGIYTYSIIAISGDLTLLISTHEPPSRYPYNIPGKTSLGKAEALTSEIPETATEPFPAQICQKSILPVVSIVVPFWGYLLGSLI